MNNEIENNNPKVLNFPKDFLWGTSTSAYQVEGGNHNDWTEWERTEARLKKLEKNGKNPADFICGRAGDFYHRYEADFNLAKGMNNNAIRIGLEWSRLEPSKGVWNVEAVQYYRRVLTAAKERGLTTVVTLWHWTNPLWLVEEGGWENKNVIKYFSEYVSLIVKELGGLIDYWVVLNEPMMYVFGAYISRRHPPQKFSLFKAEKNINNLIGAYDQTYDLIHKHFPNAQVGVTNMLNYFEPAHIWNPVESAIAKLLDFYWNQRIVKKTLKCDYLGMNYYFHDRIVWYPPFKHNKNKWVNDKGWEIYPEGIYHVLKYLSKYGKPIFIMENGVADDADSSRSEFIKEHLRYVHRAIEEGADVRGYFYWSLLDNFEWAWGWSPKFGLYKVDRNTLERTPRPSAAYYRNVCKNNGLIV
jgi:beta-glucosidase